MILFDIETLKLAVRAAMLIIIDSDKAVKVARLIPKEAQDVLIEEAYKLRTALEIKKWT